MDMHEASRILNMDLLGLTPCDFDLSDDDFGPITDDDWLLDDRFAPGGENTLTIQYDAMSELERDLIASAVASFVMRRTTASNVRVELT